MNPQRPKYFVDYSDLWSPGGISGNDIPKLPIGYAFAGIPFAKVIAQGNKVGPGGKPGALLVPSGALPNQYNIKDDEWYPLDAALGPNEWAVRTWLGYPKGTPKPGPRELLRPDVRSGEFGVEHPLKLWKTEYCERFADGNVWEIPVARRFDFEKTEAEFLKNGYEKKINEAVVQHFADSDALEKAVVQLFAGSFRPVMQTVQTFKDGHWADGEPSREFRNLWELALRVHRLVDGTQSAAEFEEMPSVTSDAAKNAAIRILQVFYNIGVTEASWLEMFTEELFVYVLHRFCDYPGYAVWRQKKILDAFQNTMEMPLDLTSTEMEPSNSGTMDGSPDTLQPSPN